jgi:hypothetical protein
MIICIYKIYNKNWKYLNNLTNRFLELKDKDLSIE